MKTLVLHIGANKTGSSALQSGFAKYHRQIRDAGYYYPPHANFEKAAEGKFSSGNGDRLRALLVPRFRTEHYDEASELRALVTDIADAPAGRVLISNEGLHRAARPLLETFLSACAEADIEVHAYFYVRDLLDHAYSSYMQNVKMGRETRAFGDFLDEYRSSFSSSCTTFRNALGNRFHVRVYEEHKANLLQGFLQWAGIDIGEAVEIGQVNRSLSVDEVFVLRQLNLLQVPQRVRGRIGKNIMDSSFKTERHTVDIGEDQLTGFRERMKDELAAINTQVEGREVRLVSDDLEIVDRYDNMKTTPREEALVRILNAVVSEL